MSTEPLESNENEDRPLRKGGARERHRRRVEQRQQGPAPTTPIAVPRVPTVSRPRFNNPASRQLIPAGKIKLPKIQLSQTRLPLYIIGGVIFVLMGVFLLGQLRNREPEPRPNAIWLGTEWTYERRTEANIAQLADQLRDHQIGTVYAWVSYLGTDGIWAGDPSGSNRFDDVSGSVQAFVAEFKRLYPDVQIFAWIGLPAGADPQNYGMEAELYFERVVEFNQRAVSGLGFDGVFLQVEPVASGDENFMTILRQVRASFGDSVPLAVAVPPDWTPLEAGLNLPSIYAPDTFWETTYKQRVALVADQIVVMVFNSGFTDADDYTQWVAYQVQMYASTIAELQGETELIIAIPTQDANLPVHDPQIENVGSALNGIEQGMAAAGDAALVVRGVGLYAEWTTDESEWAQFRSQWLR